MKAKLILPLVLLLLLLAGVQAEDQVSREDLQKRISEINTQITQLENTQTPAGAGDVAQIEAFNANKANQIASLKDERASLESQVASAPPAAQIQAGATSQQDGDLSGLVVTDMQLPPTASEQEGPQATITQQNELQLNLVGSSKATNTREGRQRLSDVQIRDIGNYVRDEFTTARITVDDADYDLNARPVDITVYSGKSKTKFTAGKEGTQARDLNAGRNSLKTDVFLDANGNVVSYRQSIKADKKSITIKEMYLGTVTVDGSTSLVKVERLYGGEFAGVEQTKYTLIDDSNPNNLIYPKGQGESMTLDFEGEVVEGTSDNPVFEQIQRKYKYDRVYTAFQRGVGWSSISSLFCGGSCFEEWALQVDKIFHDAYLGSEYWTEALCRVASDIDSNTNAIFSASADSGMFVSGIITATRQTITSPQGTRYLYQVSFFFRNPEASSDRGKSSSSKGTIARGSSSSSQNLDKEEKELWNGIKDGARDIQSGLASTSPRASGEDIGYNIIFEGERRIELFVQNQVIEEGEEIAVTQDDSIAAYSNYKYNKVCLVFPDEKPLDAFYREIDEICTDITQVNPQPTTIEVRERQSSKVSGDIREI